MKVKVLIIRFSSIGDIVLTTPVIRCLKKQLEGEVEIHYLTKSVYSELLEHNPHIDKVYGIDKSTNEVIDSLKSEAYDYVVDLHKNLRSLRVKRKLPALAFSFDKLNFQKWLLVNFKIDRLPKIHIVDRYLGSVKALGVENDGEGLDYFIPEGVSIEDILPPDFGADYIALVLGANHYTKKIPFEKLQKIISDSAAKFVLIGGKEDSQLGNHLEDGNSKIFNAAGRTTLTESAVLLKHAEAVITPDTGMMHIAAALKKKIISIWGNTVPEFGMYAYVMPAQEHMPVIIENKDLSCRPCSKIGFDKCPKGHFHCMEMLDTSEVVAEIGAKKRST